MKIKHKPDQICLLCAMLLALPDVVQAQFSYTTNNAAISINYPSCASGAATIPSMINGLPVTSISSQAFANCTNLTSVTIGPTVTSIGSAVFAGCSILTAINVDSNNPAYSSVNGVLFDKGHTTLLEYPASKVEISYTILDGVNNIAEGAFLGCHYLTSVTIPNSVTSIENGAFTLCDSLIHVTIPDSVTNIGVQAFASCGRLTSVTIPNGVNEIRQLVFFACTNLTEVTIPNSVNNIRDNAFIACIRLTSVTIPDSVTGIGEEAFSACINLNGIYFLGNAPSVGSNIFSNDDFATVYYLAGTTGWEAKFAGRPTALWKSKAKAMGLNQDGADLLLNRCAEYFSNGDFVKAQAEVDEAIELKPDYAEAYFIRGTIKDRRHDYDGEMLDLNKAIELKPDFASSYKFRGGIKASRGDRAEAIADFTKAIDLKINDAETYWMRGAQYNLINENDKALADISKAIELKPDYAAAFFTRGCLKESKINDLVGALADYNRAIELKQNLDETTLEQAIERRDSLKVIVIEGKNPLIKEATRTVWNRIQAIEAQLAKDYASDKKTIFSQRGFLYAQINTDNADPALKKYIAQVVDVSKDTKSVLDSIDEEKRNTAQAAKDIENFYTVLGTFLGATAQNNRSLTENVQDGQTAGMIAGKLGAGILISIPSSTFDGEIKRCQSNLEILTSNFSLLQVYLSKKYNAQFLSAF